MKRIAVIGTAAAALALSAVPRLVAAEEAAGGLLSNLKGMFGGGNKGAAEVDASGEVIMKPAAPVETGATLPPETKTAADAQMTPEQIGQLQAQLSALTPEQQAQILQQQYLEDMDLLCLAGPQ